MGVQVKSANLLGTGVSYAYAVKAGPWIFLTGQEGFDFETGVPAAVAGPAGFPLYGRPRWRREGDFILARMRRILQEFGSDLAHGVRLEQFYPTPAAVDPYHLARRAAFGDYIPPSTSVIMERCFGAETGISSSLLAVVPSAGYEIRKVYPKDVTASASSGFVPTVVCNDFVFVAGQMASGGDHGLDPRAHVPDHTAWGGTEIRKQTEFIIVEKLKPALEAAGSSLDRSVKAQVYLKNARSDSRTSRLWQFLRLALERSFALDGRAASASLSQHAINCAGGTRDVGRRAHRTSLFGECGRGNSLPRSAPRIRAAVWMGMGNAARGRHDTAAARSGAIHRRRDHCVVARAPRTRPARRAFQYRVRTRADARCGARAQTHQS
jgi:enamine deaminase RidA (YjgF/YER057c/UK114 family)